MTPIRGSSHTLFNGRATPLAARDDSREGEYTMAIRNLLQQLIGSGFTVSLIIDGTQLTGQKVVSVGNDVVTTVNNAGLVRVTRIADVLSVDF